MDIQLSMRGVFKDQESRSLHRWLLGRESELQRSGVHMAPPPTPRPGEMGGVFEIIQFAVDTTAQFGSLALALAAWRSAHGARSTLVIERDGFQVTLEGADLDDEERIRRLLESLRESDG